MRLQITIALLATSVTSVLALPSINLGFNTFPSGGKFVAWDASISEKEACSNNVMITGSDGGPAPPRCGTPFSLEGIDGLTLTCLSDNSTVTGINQNGVQVEACEPVFDEGTACTAGVELTQAYACVPV